ncbi:MAG: TRAP transporter small permease [Desulfobacterales bacterium]|nr:TRAP transporter small permease [Desulfobacterales bacterium]
MRKFWVIFDKTNQVMMHIACLLLVLIMLAISIDVLLRYFLNISFGGLLELVEYCLLWMTFLGATHLLKTDAHVNADLVLTRMNPRNRAFLDIATCMLAAIVFGLLSYFGVVVVWQHYQSNLRLASVLMPYKWPIVTIIPMGSFLLFIQLLRKAYNLANGLKRERGGQE